MFKKSMVTKIIMSIFMASVVVAVIITAFFMLNTRAVMISEGEKMLNEIASKESQKIEVFFNRVDYFIKALNTLIKSTIDPNQIEQKGLTYLAEYEKGIMTDIMIEMSKTIPEQITAYFFANPYEYNIAYSFTFQNLKGEGTTRQPNIELDYYFSESDDQSWIKDPINQRKIVFTEPYYWEGLGDIISVVAPVIVNNTVIGVVGVDVTFDYIQKIVAESKAFKTGYGFLMNEQGMIIAHKALDFGTMLSGDNKMMWESFLQSNRSDQAVFHYEQEGKKTVAAFKELSAGWFFVEVVPESELLESLTRLQGLVLIITAVTLLIILVFSYFLGKGLTKPIKEMVNGIVDFGNGDFTQEFVIKGEDEIALMASSLNKMALSLKSSMRAVNESAQLIDTASDQLNQIAKMQDTNAEVLAEKSQQVESNVQNTSASIEEVTSGIQEVAASAQDVSKNSQNLSSQINETETYVKKGREILKTQSIMMEKVGVQNTQTTELVQTVAEKANNVQEIVNTISSISEQTNLLALNAAIEAARAGEAGKGFAVVADEIRKLAEESKRSSSNIANILHEINESSDSASEAVTETVGLYKELEKSSHEVVNAFESILNSITSIDSNIESLTGVAQEQSATSEEMASAMDTSAKSITEISEEIEQMNTTVKKQKEASSEVTQASDELKALAQRLLEKVKYFKLN